MADFWTTKQVAEVGEIKPREVTTYAKKYGLTPAQSFDGRPMWTPEEARSFHRHHERMAKGLLCTECGRTKPTAPQNATEPTE